MTEREKLQAERRRIHAALEQLDQADALEHSRALVGRYFKYRNSYSCPQKASDYWWLYARTDRLDRAGTLHGVTFQIDSRGEITVAPQRFMWQLFGDGSKYQPITRAEFQRAWTRTQRAIKALVP